MQINVVMFIKVIFVSAIVTLLMGTSSSVQAFDGNDQLEDKLYRQALYFYFTGNYSEALMQVSLNRQRFKTNSSRSHLFEAGLQVSVGLHKQAEISLNKFEQSQALGLNNNSTPVIEEQGKSNTSPEELKLIALLQLTEQKIQQSDNQAAQHALRRMTQVPNAYREQYHTLSQLAYWPEQPPLTALNNTIETSQQSSASAYIALNKALQLIEQQEFEPAKILLETIKNTEWQAQSVTFWQVLFNPFLRFFDQGIKEETNEDKIQQQAINDYARLLLAQLYIKQELYEAAYYELKDFPQDSPYTESALFIFAFSAQKIRQFTTSFTLLDLMQKRYPYSNLGWQSALLFSAQATEQKSLEQGMTSYQQTAKLYQQRLSDLTRFNDDFLMSEDVLSYLSLKPEKKQAKNSSNSQPLTSNTPLTTDSLWLKKALLNTELQSQYQTLIELDLLSIHLQEQRLKSQWLYETLELNKLRKANITEKQKRRPYQAIITELRAKKQHIADMIAQAENKQQGHIFADPNQARLLKRIKQSKQAINVIDGHRNIDEYQERLARVEGVITWQLQGALPQRLWQHKKQLNVLERELVHIEQQQKRFDVLSDPELGLAKTDTHDLVARQQKSSTKITSLLNAVAQVRAETSHEIRENVNDFVSRQRTLLEQHALTTRHEMAGVLEKMLSVDKRIEQQLVPAKQTQSNAVGTL